MAFDVCVLTNECASHLSSLKSRDFVMNEVRCFLLSDKLTALQIREKTAQEFLATLPSDSVTELSCLYSVSQEVNISITGEDIDPIPQGYTVLVLASLVVNGTSTDICLCGCVSDELIVSDSRLKFTINIEETKNVFSVHADFDGAVVQGLLHDNYVTLKTDQTIFAEKTFCSEQHPSYYTVISEQGLQVESPDAYHQNDYYHSSIDSLCLSLGNNNVRIKNSLERTGSDSNLLSLCVSDKDVSDGTGELTYLDIMKSGVRIIHGDARVDSSTPSNHEVLVDITPYYFDFNRSLRVNMPYDTSVFIAQTPLDSYVSFNSPIELLYDETSSTYYFKSAFGELSFTQAMNQTKVFDPSTQAESTDASSTPLQRALDGTNYLSATVGIYQTYGSSELPSTERELTQQEIDSLGVFVQVGSALYVLQQADIKNFFFNGTMFCLGGITTDADNFQLLTVSPNNTSNPYTRHICVLHRQDDTQSISLRDYVTSRISESSSGGASSAPTTVDYYPLLDVSVSRSQGEIGALFPLSSSVTGVPHYIHNLNASSENADLVSAGWTYTNQWNDTGETYTDTSNNTYSIGTLNGSDEMYFRFNGELSTYTIEEIMTNYGSNTVSNLTLPVLMRAGNDSVDGSDMTNASATYSQGMFNLEYSTRQHSNYAAWWYMIVGLNTDARMSMFNIANYSGISTFRSNSSSVNPNDVPWSKIPVDDYMLYTDPVSFGGSVQFARESASSYEYDTGDTGTDYEGTFYQLVYFNYVTTDSISVYSSELSITINGMSYRLGSYTATTYGSYWDPAYEGFVFFTSTWDNSTGLPWGGNSNMFFCILRKVSVTASSGGSDPDNPDGSTMGDAGMMETTELGVMFVPLEPEEFYRMWEQIRFGIGGTISSRSAHLTSLSDVSGVRDTYQNAPVYTHYVDGVGYKSSSSSSFQTNSYYQPDVFLEQLMPSILTSFRNLPSVPGGSWSFERYGSSAPDEKSTSATDNLRYVCSSPNGFYIGTPVHNEWEVSTDPLSIKDVVLRADDEEVIITNVQNVRNEFVTTEQTVHGRVVVGTAGNQNALVVSDEGVSIEGTLKVNGQTLEHIVQTSIDASSGSSGTGSGSDSESSSGTGSSSGFSVDSFIKTLYGSDVGGLYFLWLTFSMTGLTEGSTTGSVNRGDLVVLNTGGTGILKKFSSGVTYGIDSYGQGMNSENIVSSYDKPFDDVGFRVLMDFNFISNSGVCVPCVRVPWGLKIGVDTTVALGTTALWSDYFWVYSFGQTSGTNWWNPEYYSASSLPYTNSYNESVGDSFPYLEVIMTYDNKIQDMSQVENGNFRVDIYNSLPEIYFTPSLSVNDNSSAGVILKFNPSSCYSNPTNFKLPTDLYTISGTTVTWNTSHPLYNILYGKTFFEV